MFRSRERGIGTPDPQSLRAFFAGREPSFSRSARPPARVLCRGLASAADDGLDEFHFIRRSPRPAIMSTLAFPRIHDVAAVAAHGGVIVALALTAYLHVIRRPTMRAAEVAWRRIAWGHRLRSKLVAHLRGHDVRVLSQLGHARVQIRTCGRWASPHHRNPPRRTPLRVVTPEAGFFLADRHRGLRGRRLKGRHSLTRPVHRRSGSRPTKPNRFKSAAIFLRLDLLLLLRGLRGLLGHHLPFVEFPHCEVRPPCVVGPSARSNHRCAIIRRDVRAFSSDARRASCRHSSAARRNRSERSGIVCSLPHRPSMEC
jgi:hypothetical protein